MLEGRLQVLWRVPELQWVHGPRTVVMAPLDRPACGFLDASMGPRSENRGYEHGRPRGCDGEPRRFNGSTVREPWLCPARPPAARSSSRFNGSTVREPWLCTPKGKT